MPILNDFQAWLTKEQHRVLPKSEIGKAFTYTLNQFAALCRYTEDGAVSVDNNLAERPMKLPAIGRKNWLFVGSEQGGEQGGEQGSEQGSEQGGERAAMLLSIIASAKLCHVEP